MIAASAPQRAGLAPHGAPPMGARIVAMGASARSHAPPSGTLPSRVVVIAPTAVTPIGLRRAASALCRRGRPSGGEARARLQAQGELVAAQTDGWATPGVEPSAWRGLRGTRGRWRSACYASGMPASAPVGGARAVRPRTRAICAATARPSWSSTASTATLDRSPGGSHRSSTSATSAHAIRPRPSRER